jgi:hypothetical protein
METLILLVNVGRQSHGGRYGPAVAGLADMGAALAVFNDTDWYYGDRQRTVQPRG